MRTRRTLSAVLAAGAIAGALVAANADAAPRGYVTVSPELGNVDDAHLIITASGRCDGTQHGIHIRVAGESFPQPSALVTSIAVPEWETFDGYWPLDIGTWSSIAAKTGATMPLAGSGQIIVQCYSINGPAAAGLFESTPVPFRAEGATFGDPCSKGYPDCPNLPSPTLTLAPTPAPTVAPPAPTPAPVFAPAAPRRPLTKAQMRQRKRQAAWLRAHGWAWR